MVKNVFFFLALFLTVQNASSQKFNWAKQTKTVPGYEAFSFGEVVEATEEGYFFGGVFQGKVLLEKDTLAENKELPNSNLAGDVILFKTDKQGNILWKHQIGGNDYYWDDVLALAVDSKGSSYWAVSLTGNNLLDGKPFLFSKQGTPILKFDSQGNLMDTIFSPIGAKKLKIDPQDHLYVLGSYYGDLTLDDTTLALSSKAVNMVVTKYAPDGNLLWATHAGGTETEWTGTEVIGLDMVFNPEGSLFLLGTLKNNAAQEIHAWFGSLPVPERGGENPFGFVCQLNVDGRFNWVQTDSGVFERIQVMNNGNILLASSYAYVFTSKFVQLEEGDYTKRALVLELDPSAQQLISTTRLASLGTDELTISDFERDAAGNTYLAGGFAEGVTCGNLSISSSTIKTYILKFSPTGTPTDLLKTEVTDWGNSLQLSVDDATNDLILCGRLDGTKVFGTILLETDVNTSNIVYASMQQKGLPLSLANENTITPDWNILPNPATDELRWNGIDLSEVKEIRIESMDGTTHPLLPNQRIDISEFASGIYVLAIETAETTFKKRFVKI